MNIAFDVFEIDKEIPLLSNIKNVKHEYCDFLEKKMATKYMGDDCIYIMNMTRKYTVAFTGIVQ